MPFAEPLTLPEALLLLALDDNKGTMIGRLPELNRAIIAAGLLELWLRSHLVALSPPRQKQILRYIEAILQDVMVPMTTDSVLSASYTAAKRLCLFVVQPSPTPIANAYLQALYAPLQRQLLNNWEIPATFTLLVRTYQESEAETAGTLPGNRSQVERVADALVARGVLQRAEQTRFALGPKTTYPAAPGDTGESEVRLRLRGVILHTKDPHTDEWTRSLLGLVRACGLLDTVFGKENREVADWRIVKLCKVAAEPASPLANALAFVGAMRIGDS